MFHHIAPINRKKIRYNDHLKISPEYLDQTFTDLEKRGFSFVSLDELADLLEKHEKPSKILAVTFDDGYRDNLVNGVPVLEQHNIPGTIFVATGLMCGEIIPWWNVLEDYLLGTSGRFEFEGGYYSAGNMEEKCQTFLAIREKIMSASDSEIRRRLTAAGILPAGAGQKEFSRDMMSETDLKQYSNHRLISFGSHTHSHCACGNLEPEIFAGEVQQSMEILKSCGITVKHFAYPYGDDVNPRKDFTEILQSNQIRSAVTTYAGLLCSETSRWFLPRFFVSEYSGAPVYSDICRAELGLAVRIVKRRLHLR